ncbi:MAG TPA: hypothetical protein VJ023_20470 [Pyrinomonadaceae bacterium]|nr:hypothetical protein [Pyrinomonadaceae bacterium]
MSEERPWKRIRERLELQLPVRVHCRETVDFEWTELTRLTDVTPFGAGFILKRPTERGRLLHMTIPMPRQLRVFDHVEDQYRVWALVRHLRALESSPGKSPLFDVGVAFVGKRPPQSYEEDPTKRFDVASSLGQKLALKEVSPPVVSTADLRVHTRHNIPVDILLEVLDDKNEVAKSENTVTENISLRGATLFTTLTIPVGRFIRLTSTQYDVRVHGVIRARKTPADGIPRIHVEFIDRDWPL